LNKKQEVMFSTEPSPMTLAKVMPSSQVLVAYGVFLSLSAWVYHVIADGEFSSIVAVGVVFQCGAFVTLAMQVISSGSCAGISARSLALEALALCCKLSSTLYLDGYLPNDASGDWFYQAADVCSLLVVLWLLHQILVTRRSAYQADEDSAPYVPTVVVVCILLSALLHGDMDNYPLFDMLYMCGILLGVVAVLPQLWLIAHVGGKVEALTSHYIAMAAVARVCSGIFMWTARDDITCVPWVKGVNHAIWLILSVHLLHLLLLADFAYIYVRTMVTQGVQARVDVDSTIFEV
jgi:hypothetical protein